MIRWYLEWRTRRRYYERVLWSLGMRPGWFESNRTRATRILRAYGCGGLRSCGATDIRNFVASLLAVDPERVRLEQVAPGYVAVHVPRKTSRRRIARVEEELRDKLPAFVDFYVEADA